ncbi:thioesterase II family protein [Streptomyces sp. NPDC088746]|uniref:thioesterase II family protein n=1 Tax=Streptomyces sp. NPDC088746 TaxID=3365885 RepID=UPI00382B2C15
MISGPTPWLLAPPADGAAEERLFCFPHAGAGASVFGHWRARMPDSVDLFPVQLPGRENRSSDPMPDTLEELTEQTAEALLPYLRTPYVLLGHSFGGLLAYALARRLHEQGHPLPRRLLISGTRPPHLAATTSYHTLSHDGLLGFLREINAVHDVLLEHEEFVRRLLHVLRTDLRIAAEYMPGTATPLPCDIQAFAAADDPVVPAGLMEHWRDYTVSEFSVSRAPGGHHTVYDVSGGLFAAIVRSGLARS